MYNMAIPLWSLSYSSQISCVDTTSLWNLPSVSGRWLVGESAAAARFFVLHSFSLISFISSPLSFYWQMHTTSPLFSNVCAYPGWNAIYFHNTIITCCFTTKVTVCIKSKFFRKKLTQNTENESSERMKL